ncbi:MAG: C1 family peptidase [Legionella sp.]|uniref:C1 family peptidase n=1 Tax=Legionella sp. TaxID=459 RepID=UPI0039E5F634
MKLKTILITLAQVAVLVLLMIKCVVAGDVAVTGSMEHSITQSNQSLSLKRSNNNEKIIQFLKIHLSDEGKELLATRMKEIEDHSEQLALMSNAAFPGKVQVAMNNVPVLDQGRHGTCVTFAITAALDATMDKGDYISQLCNLQLGSYLENHGYIKASGWDGSLPIWVIHQIEQYGVISKEKQKTTGCGGLTEYPTDTQYSPVSFIEPEQYYLMSELVFGKSANWSNIYWRISSSWTLSEVKAALNSGDRAVFAVIFPRVDLGVAGAIGKYKRGKDTWVLTSEIKKAVYDATAAHEMIITGYDDDALAVDNKGKEHKGLLTLRNSWGSKVGDNGNFYMSYDYFKLLTFDVRRFSPNAH